MELQMLRGNAIPFLLPVEWIEIDGNVTFRYSIAGTRMLSHQVHLHPLTMQDMYACLLAVADGLEACKSYLLRPECCLLQESCLFIGERWDEVFLLYVPVLEPEGGNKQEAERARSFTALVMRLAAHVKELDGSGLQRLLKQLQDERGIRSALRKTLLELIEGGPGPTYPVEEALESQYRQSGTSAGFVWPLSRFSVHQASGEMGDREGNEPRSGIYEPGTMNKPVEPLMEQAIEEPVQAALLAIDSGSSREPLGRSKWGAFAIAAIAIALVWRYGYMAQPTDDRLLICLGATVILAVAALMAGWRGRGREESALAAPIKKRGSGLEQPRNWLSDAELSDRREAGAPVHADRWSFPGSPPVPSVANAAIDNDGAETEHHHSAIVRLSIDEPAPASEATAWIGRERNKQSGQLRKEQAEAKFIWHLERTEKGENERIMLPFPDSPLFLIGRSGGKVHYADEHPGISRVHLELGADEDGYTAKDLGSRNGTTLNGSPMIAYKIYKLQSEDELQLAGHDGPIYKLREVKEAAGV